MAEVRLSLDGDALREATVQAMFGILTPEVQKDILQQAIDAILKPSTNSWDKGKSPIENAFVRAVDTLAYEVAQEMVKKDESIRAKLEALLEKASRKILDEDVDKMADRMATAFISSMRDR